MTSILRVQTIPPAPIQLLVAAGGVVILLRWGLSTRTLVGPVAAVQPVGVQRYLKEAQGGTAQ
ncbi:hypothetical protein DMB66_24140 [Actinoplanes sp. ATCC 53533]|uniref:hypothetical protein n=1 Tax=Actinoplanes sp. ATCC 53533 TaxID=1288362 RepID=UPI000F7AFE5F|nr:hypothetical protein [Actinoplanes sp. ATCC 53533]RSM61624.1 hypothetical protein DMB66_24140 [Actinoplanes sp. ATCC 53533]